MKKIESPEERLAYCGCVDLIKKLAIHDSEGYHLRQRLAQRCRDLKCKCFEGGAVAVTNALYVLGKINNPVIEDKRYVYMIHYYRKIHYYHKRNKFIFAYDTLETAKLQADLLMERTKGNWSTSVTKSGVIQHENDRGELMFIFRQAVLQEADGTALDESDY